MSDGGTAPARAGDGPPPSGPAPADPPARDERPWWRREGAAFVELFALSGFAVAQPLLDVFGRAPTQFIFRDATASDVVAFGLVVTLALPLVLWAVEALVGLLWRPARRAVHLAFVAGLVAAFVVQAARGPLNRAPLLVVAALAGALGALLLARVAPARLWVRFASVGPVAFLALFLFASETAPLVTGGDVGSAEVAVGSPAPVVVVVLDELPLNALVRADGTIDDELYPHLAALAGTSTWYRNATAVSASTWYAVPAIATGRLPRDGTAPVAADHPESLFTLLGRAYDMRVTESVTRLCPRDLCEVAPSASGGARRLLVDAASVLRDRLSYTGEFGDITTGMVEAPFGGAEPAAEPDDPDGSDPFGDFALNQPDRFRTFLDGLDDDPATLHYLHLLLPHVPYRYLPSGALYEVPMPEQSEDDTWPDDAWAVDLARQRLLLQLAYVDALVGEMVATLEERGAFDDALVVVTSDHGISFEPGGPIRGIAGQPIDAATRGEVAWVPLIVKEPGQAEGRVSDVNALTIDVLPTIADVLDVDLPWEVDGRSLRGPARSDPTKPFHPAEVNVFGVESLDPVDLDPDAGWARVTAEAVDRFLPPAGEGHRLWRPRASAASALVGRPVDDLGDRLELLDAEVVDPGRLAAGADRSTALGLVEGRLPAAVAGAEVAVALNGTVAAVVPARAAGGGAVASAMVDDALQRDGDQEVTFHRVRP